MLVEDHYVIHKISNYDIIEQVNRVDNEKLKKNTAFSFSLYLYGYISSLWFLQVKIVLVYETHVWETQLEASPKMLFHLDGNQKMFL